MAHVGAMPALCIINGQSLISQGMQQTGERRPRKRHATFEAAGVEKETMAAAGLFRADEDRVIDRTAIVTVPCKYSAMSDRPSTRRVVSLTRAPANRRGTELRTQTIAVSPRSASRGGLASQAARSKRAQLACSLPHRKIVFVKLHEFDYRRHGLFAATQVENCVTTNDPRTIGLIQRR
jgi:hypothetical protein